MDFSPNSNFELHINLWVTESSPDSHSDYYEVKIIDKEVNFRWEHSGFPDPNSKTKTLKLNDNLFNKLIGFIKEKKFNSNISESKPLGNLGISISINIDLKLENQINNITINGMYNDWQLSGTGKSCNIENHLYYHHVNRILSMIQNDLKSI